MSLPQETLALVFSHLEAKDLRHCQLTSKQWHEASLRPLYSNLLVDTLEKLFKYVRTIKYSPQLGEYLNTIDFYYFFYGVGESDEFNSIGLLDSVIEYCPNITKMDGLVEDDRFWSRLMYAATQGQLSRLESLPRNTTPIPKSFIDATLVFKNTLTSLWVYCDNFNYQPTSVYSTPYEAGCNRINQFKNLDTLYIETPSVNHLSYFDELIDKFHSLKTLDLSITYDTDRTLAFIKPGPTILPRKDIRSLTCFWSQINEESQLEYLMRKFPNLQHLEVGPKIEGSHHGRLALKKFIQYALSVPDFYLDIEIEEEQILDVWTEFAKTKNVCKKVTLHYLNGDSFFPYAMHELSLSREFGFCPTFLILYQYDYGSIECFPQIKFLSEVGRSLRSLRIVDANLFQGMHHSQRTIAWLFDIIQLCPLLEELIVGGLKSSSTIHHTLQYPSLKKLSLDGSQNMKSLDFLHCLSLSFPNLCQLSLTLGYNNMSPVIIDMPHTFFDLLIWNDDSCKVQLFTAPQVYVKLKTEKGLEYYLRERSTLVPINESCYLLSPKNVRFDIRCKHLKELRIRRRALPKSDSDFIF